VTGHASLRETQRGGCGRQAPSQARAGVAMQVLDPLRAHERAAAWGQQGPPVP
jgi:hypothetical protein